ncbi:flagellar brake domain-containing protein [Planctobacterium marinum]|uniref:flagellar brake domain-containing protein n=1 Tax=Planctobacterium marinum TaxID=1631968 RepID=UPI001E37BDAF|nr:flagellar brake protein [Planctobacterium marinum]MCC2604240.1 flagellar brake protein [Planctobacterium marinum]
MAILASRQKLSSADVNKLRSLKPGLPVDFQLSFPNTVKRVRSEFIGADGRKTLIFKFPDEKKYGPLRDGLYVDGQVIVRLVLEDSGEIVAFKAKVKAITMSPIHAVWVNFPEAVQVQGLRAEKRTQIRVPCELNAVQSKISDEHKSRLGEGMILDISGSGCRVGVTRKGREKIEDKQIMLTISAPGNQEDFKFRSEVMNVRMDELYFYYGLRFEEKNHYTEALLERLMVSQ